MNNKPIYIGKVIEISNLTVTIMVDKRIKTTVYIENGESTILSGIGNLVKIQNNIYEITNEKVNLNIESKNDQDFESSRIITAKLLGYFSNYRFVLGNCGRLPNLLDNVYTLKEQEISVIYANSDPNQSINIGTFSNLFNHPFYVPINSFFGSHVLIVGNTGSGKSTSVNTLFSELFNRIIQNHSSKFLFIDTNGEYTDAFTSRKLVKRLSTSGKIENEISIPINLLEQEDWKLLLEATEKTQYPIIRTTCKFLKTKIFRDDTEIGKEILKQIKDILGEICLSSANANSKFQTLLRLIDDISYFEEPFYNELYNSLSNIVSKYSINNGKIILNDVYNDESKTLNNEINQINIGCSKDSFNVYDFGYLLDLEHNRRVYKYNLNETNASPMISRFLSHRGDYSRIFTAYNKCENNEILSNLFENESILVIDVSKTDKYIRRIMVSFLCSKLYSLKIKEDKLFSLHLIVDEAHNYLSDQRLDKEDAVAKSCIETFETIIKEGRKFGVYLTMATQRPSDISSTLLSQSHNYVIHKLVNPKDIEIIKNAVSFIDERSISLLSVLSPGQAIFSGTAFNRPSLVDVKISQNTKVNSENRDLLSEWDNT